MISTLSSRLQNIKNMLLTALMVVSLMRYEASGSTQRIKELMPWSLSLSLALRFFIISMMIFLSDLSAFGSLRPGVSIKDISPIVPSLKHPVTDLKDFSLLNKHL